MAINVIINYWAVIVAAVVMYALGALWYSVLFGKAWARAGKMTKEMMEAAQKKGMAWRYVLMLVGSFLTAYILAHFIQYTGSMQFTDGMVGGFWIWLGFYVPVLSGQVLWEGKPFAYYLINVTYYLVGLLLMGGILAAWH